MTTAVDAARQLVVFGMGEDEFAVEIEFVQEILPPVPTRSVPESPAILRGLFDLRGHVIPLLDLRDRLGRGARRGAERVLVAHVSGRNLGFVVDGVREVLRVGSKGIERAPEEARSLAKPYLKGVIRYAGRILLLLDLEKILSDEEFERIRK